MKRIVITGVGIVSPCGNNAEQFEASLRLGRSGIKVNEWYDTEGFVSKEIGKIVGFEIPNGLSERERRHCSQVDFYALSAAQEALASAELKVTAGNCTTMGIVLGSGGAVADTETYVRNMLLKQNANPSKLLASNPDKAGNTVAAHFDLHGPRSSIMTACSSGATAIGYAADFIKEGYAEIMLAGGVESTSYVTLSGFNALGAMCAGKNRPFDRNRDGIVLGEAGAILVLESLEHALRRGAPIIAEFVAYGLSSDAHHITAPHPEGEGMVRAMQQALKLGKIGVEQICYINAHGTGTLLNDKSESAAIRNVFGAHADALCVSTIKPMTGHTLSAAGAVEALATVLSLNGQFVPPTLNYQTPDPDCNLDCVPNFARNLEMDYAMSNSLAFGGNNTSLIFKHYQD
ncbi:beta-ketoacyl-[acyl-carrier-protein] synthase family protein [Methylicorpusculum oleiharenae]|uniref:beta-ketoacyl-[acyl-carrier-protein] synthase family protein n=1 Tax=Methylicorpusculum oleiharenae TaxID=1338687 RepID=UPI00135BA8C7|nr:beta-ketoacyl-[acyl-carrier-protein] synthase family protein [Methylicorpusculum oleiharenae]MCD2451465.1 beta-ketoacyl-[acyl-carrier-protein] synthase family protein [Methylicorpusculum oleiharenae]